MASQFPRSTLLVEEDATHKTVREAIRSASVLHFATHGIVHAVPYRSAILPADGQCLSVQDCMSLGLDADLAVISACESGQGEITRGDEVLGLARGFLAAGVRCVMVSQWAIHDRVTGLLMKQFYREYTSGENPAEALAHAQAWLCELDETNPDAQSILATSIKAGDINCLHRPFAHPRYWSAFVLLEAGNRVPSRHEF